MAPLLSRYLATPPSGNCLLFLADWIAIARGVDLAAPYRGRCETRDQWTEILRHEGGMRALMLKALQDFPTTDRPKAGDVALVRVLSQPALGAICIGSNGYAMKSADFDLTIAGPPAVKPILVWSV